LHVAYTGLKSQSRGTSLVPSSTKNEEDEPCALLPRRRYFATYRKCVSAFCCPCGGAPVAPPLNMKPSARPGEAGGAESQGARSPGGGDGGGRANAATPNSPRAAT